MTKTTATTRTPIELAQMKSARAEQLSRFIRLLESDIEDRHKYDWYHVKDENGNTTEEIQADELINIEAWQKLEEEILSIM